MSHPPDNRAPWAAAWGWASLVISISLEMVLPGLLGYWVDRQLGTVMVFLVLGLALGMTAGLIQLIGIAKAGLPNGGPHGGRPSGGAALGQDKDEKRDPNN